MSDAAADDTLGGLVHSPLQHFTLLYYAALLRVLEHASSFFGSVDAAVERLPFLGGYFNEMAERGLEGASFAEAHRSWRRAVEAWERASVERLPVVAFREAAALEYNDIVLLAQIGLPEEDPRFGLLFETLHGVDGERRATLALLAAAWQRDDAFDARASAHRLEALGAIERVPGDTGALRPSADVWEVVRSGMLASDRTTMRHRARASLPELSSLVISESLADECRNVPALVASGAVRAVVIRGPRHNGRATLAAALAHRLGRGVLDVIGLDGPRDARWRTVATLACLLDSVVLTALDPAPSETAELPAFPGEMATLFVTTGALGGISGALAERALTIRVATPTHDARERLWRTSLSDPAHAASLAGLRLTSGNIVRAARMARVATAADNDSAVTPQTVRGAVRSLDRLGLEALAKRVETVDDWSQIALPCETVTELTALTARCRHRERLADFVGPALGGLNAGVRALFKGPSGTGKTLAARMIAGALGMELYRVDLASVTNKYVGETEKSLERVFASAEELDVVLLLDEGDALLTARTGVQSANDRYANLETNFLLQRLEAYEGIIIATTNAGDRIDGAFHRRMDVVVDFPLPDAAQRGAIWRLHLPDSHVVDPDLLQSAVQRCALTGGQIRNAALHAALLAIENDSPIASAHFVSAIEREYRKQGAVSPLRVKGVEHGRLLAALAATRT